MDEQYHPSSSTSSAGAGAMGRSSVLFGDPCLFLLISLLRAEHRTIRDQNTQADDSSAPHIKSVPPREESRTS